MTTRVAIIGTGNIAGPYAQDFANYPEIEFVGVADIDHERAEKFAAEHNTRAFASPEALIGDSSVELVVNLTSHFAHKIISEAALNAGKHVYSEKPLAVTYEEASALVKLAEARGLRLGCSPFTLMGEAQQTAWKLIRSGRAGKIRVAYAEVNWGRIESWHPAPGPFYEVGALFDVGVYPLTILTSLFGPARRVLSYGSVLYPDRVTKEGVQFHIKTPDWVVTIIDLADGTVARLTTDFYVSNQTSKQRGIEFHGDLGSIYIESWQNFGAQVEFAEFGKPFEPVPHIRPAEIERTPWGRGVHEMVTAMQAGRPHRFTGQQAAHVTEILTAAALSMRLGQSVEVESSFPTPTPMEWSE